MLHNIPNWYCVAATRSFLVSRDTDNPDKYLYIRRVDQQHAM